MLNCYLCNKKISKESKHGMATAEGKKVVPSKDYTCVDVHLTNGEYTVAYATPVCKNCVPVILLGDAGNKEKLRKNVILQNKKYACGPKEFLDDNLELVSIRDLTHELIQNGVIECQ